MIDDFLDMIILGFESNLPLMMGIFALCVLGAIVLSVVGLMKARKDVRRRISTGLERRNEQGTSQSQSAMNQFMNYLETHFAAEVDAKSTVLRLQMVQAGFHDPRAVAVYFAARLGTCLILGVGLFLYLSWFVAGLSVVKIWQFTIGGALLGYLLPTFYLSRRVKKRTERNRQGFPDFMDLMVVCSEAGLSMEAAIDRIAREMVETCPSLAENLYMVSLEIRAGKSFVEALERMGQRLGIAEATTLATLLQQSSELGSSLTQSLRICSDEMRNKRLSKAEEKAYALPAKLVVPLTLFVFPVLLITLMLPVVVRVSAMMG
jgi:tight adherence protein C